MVYKLRLLILTAISTLLVFFSAQAQINIPYSIGSFGNTGGAATIFSGPVVLDGKECIYVANGVQNFSLNNRVGIFKSSCLVENMVTLSVDLFGYPNPAVNNYQLKLKNKTSYKDLTPIKIEINNIEGKSLLNLTTTIASLYAGLNLPIKQLVPGEYIIKAGIAPNKISTIKFLKIN